MRSFICNFWEIIVIVSTIVSIASFASAFIHNKSRAPFYVCMACCILLVATTGYVYFQSAKIADVVGLELHDAIPLLRQSDLYAVIEPENFDMSYIISKQDPQPGTYVKKGSNIKLFTQTQNKNSLALPDDSLSPNTQNTNSSVQSSDQNLPQASGTTLNPDHTPTLNDNDQLGDFQTIDTTLPPSQNQGSPPYTANNIPDVEPYTTEASSDESLSISASTYPISTWKNYFYLKRPDDEYGYLFYVDHDDTTHVIEDPVLDGIDIIQVSLFVDDEKVIGRETTFCLDSGAGSDLTNAFYQGITFETSPGTYVLGFVGGEIHDGPYLVEDNGDISYFREYYESTITFECSGEYQVFIN